MDKRLTGLHKTIKILYFKKSKKLLFHGWHHVNFVYKKSLEFAQETGADLSILGGGSFNPRS
jgi:hypothetical protein